MTHKHATYAKSFHWRFTHRHKLNTNTTMRYQCEVLNNRVYGYKVWLHGRNQGRSAVNSVKFISWTFMNKPARVLAIIIKKNENVQYDKQV